MVVDEVEATEEEGKFGGGNGDGDGLKENGAELIIHKWMDANQALGPGWCCNQFADLLTTAFPSRRPIVPIGVSAFIVRQFSPAAGAAILIMFLPFFCCWAATSLLAIVPFGKHDSVKTTDEFGN